MESRAAEKTGIDSKLYWWGHYRDGKKRKELEIDAVALNENTKEILFVECKWKDLSLRQADKILDDLKKKSHYVDWNNENRTEYFGITGIHFKSKGN